MAVAKKQSFNRSDPFWPIIGSVIIGSVLTIYPLPYALNDWRPHVMLLIMLFWVMCQPVWCGIWFAFSLGIFTDLMMEMPLGANALCFVAIAFLARFFTREKRIMTRTNLWIIAALASGLYMILSLMIRIMVGDDVNLMRHSLALLTSLIAWWGVYWGLRKWRAV